MRTLYQLRYKNQWTIQCDWAIDGYLNFEKPHTSIEKAMKRHQELLKEGKQEWILVMLTEKIIA